MTITTCFAPALFPYIKKGEDYVCVVVDILRATTTMVTAVNYGATLIPVSSIEKAREYKDKGFLVAGERIERNLDFSDFGNSALEFRTNEINGKTIVHTTTNGTVALSLALDYSPSKIVIGAFINLNVIANYLIEENKDVIVLCSGWKNTFCLEDSLFAGALAEILLNNGFICKDDATFCAMDLWNEAKENPLGYLDKASHVHRLRNNHLDDVFSYTFTLNSCVAVPIYENGKIVNAR